MLPPKREISRSNGRRGDNLSKRESPVLNGRVGRYAYIVAFAFLSSTVEVGRW